MTLICASSSTGPCRPGDLISGHQPRPLNRVGVLLERDGLVTLESIDMAERRVEGRAAGLHRAAVAAEHHDVVATVDEGAGDRGELIDCCHQSREDSLAYRL